MLLPACNGLFDELYDDPIVETDKNGFIRIDSVNNSGTIYIDATSYLRWVYIDLHNKRIDTTDVYSDLSPESWDIAVHRYDAKTNGAGVLETNFTSFADLLAGGELPEGDFESDKTGEIPVDMSDMINNNIVYHTTEINHQLSRWLDVNISVMPPIYTLSKKVYIVSLNDGTYAALLLSNFMNSSLVKGFMTIDYIYPLKFEQ
jgi:hypothetical protein